MTLAEFFVYMDAVTRQPDDEEGEQSLEAFQAWRATLV